jgi:cyclomaltodextrinase
MPEWAEHALWWHVYPLGFVGAPTSALPLEAPVQRRLDRLIVWLDYVVALGANGLLLGPVFASQTHGYDTVDHLRIDSRLGDEGDLVALVEAAHARGVRVLLDGVFNHVGRGFPPFQQVLAEGPTSPAADWFHLEWPEGAGPGTEPGYRDFEGHHALVALNHDAPLVAEHVVEVMNHWLALGVDGWRLDAANAVPTAFWAHVLPRVRAAHPDAYIFGEVLHGDYVAIVAEAGFDAVTQYELWKAIWSSLNDVNLHELAWSLTRHNALLESFAPLTFVGNHDVSRIASQVADPRHLAHAVVLLLTLGGTPTLYAGDEQGLAGVKEERKGGDDAVRPAFPEQPAELTAGGWELYRLHQELIGLRRRHAWLHRAHSEVLECTNDRLLYRVAAGEEALLVALNLSDDDVALPAPGAGEVLAGAATLATSADGPREATIAAHGWAVLSAARRHRRG